jgi:hypothetical protein
MATAPPTQNPRTRVRVSTRLFSDEVGLVEAGELKPARDIAYQFNNGRKFEEQVNPYEPPAE